jgi:hypothetical protein
VRPLAAGVPNVVYSRPMTNPSMKRLLTLLATLVASAIFAAGCGGDDNDGGGDGGGGGGSPVSGEQQSTDAPDSKDEAIDRCYEEAKKQEGQARETAEAACKAAETGDTDAIEEEVEEQKDDVKKQCLESAKQIPDEAARKQAEDACEKFGQ